ncbi:MAG: peptidoglycan-binding protein [Desertifilum sp.]|nr:peptidoglycan-binding protein [Desertifilum sp.]MDI9636042.1 peptidoglycan-binding domain-containing protein [Geitlerinema splendidum]
MALNQSRFKLNSFGILSAVALLPVALGSVAPVAAQTLDTDTNNNWTQQPGMTQDNQQQLGAIDDPDAMMLLGLGSQGSEVEQLQGFLQQQGYYQDDIDGIFGPNTQAAVTEFQAENDLAVDGLVGPETWNAISDSFAASPQPGTGFQQPGTQPGTGLQQPGTQQPGTQPGTGVQPGTQQPGGTTNF